MSHRNKMRGRPGRHWTAARKDSIGKARAPQKMLRVTQMNSSGTARTGISHT